jgi:hypothetical protein
VRKRDERYHAQGKHRAKPESLHNKGAKKPPKIFRPEDFKFNEDGVTSICPAHKVLHGSGTLYIVNGFEHLKYKGTISQCGPCKLPSTAPEVGCCTVSA